MQPRIHQADSAVTPIRVIVSVQLPLPEGPGHQEVWFLTDAGEGALPQCLLDMTFDEGVQLNSLRRFVGGIGF